MRDLDDRSITMTRRKRVEAVLALVMLQFVLYRAMLGLDDGDALRLTAMDSVVLGSVALIFGIASRRGRHKAPR